RDHRVAIGRGRYDRLAVLQADLRVVRRQRPRESVTSGAYRHREGRTVHVQARTDATTALYQLRGYVERRGHARIDGEGQRVRVVHQGVDGVVANGAHLDVRGEGRAEDHQAGSSRQQVHRGKARRFHRVAVGRSGERRGPVDQTDLSAPGQGARGGRARAVRHHEYRAVHVQAGTDGTTALYQLGGHVGGRGHARVHRAQVQ